MQRIEAGSVKLHLTGSRAGFEQIDALLRAGQLTSVFNIGISGIKWESERRVIVLMDGDNIMAFVNRLGVNLDFAGLRNALNSLLGPIRSLNYYTHTDQVMGIGSAFHGSLSKLQYSVHLEPQSRFSADSQLVNDAAFQINEFDTFVIVSGDGDFANLVENLRLRDKEVVIIGPSNSTSSWLMQNASKFISLEELLPQVFLPKT